MFKQLLTLIIIVIVVYVAYTLYKDMNMEEELVKQCETNSDCMVFGEDGECNCGCFNKEHIWESLGACFCAAPRSCQCIESVCTGVIEQVDEPEEPEPKTTEQTCIDSGGTVSTGLCCESAADFPNSCAIGACGCAPDYSHTVKTCICPEGKCFNGTECVVPSIM